jgi:hypothetical protein
MHRSALVAIVLLAAGAAVAGATVKPTLTLTRTNRIDRVSVAGTVAAFAVNEGRCAHAELWQPSRHRSWRFHATKGCRPQDRVSVHIQNVSNSRSRIAWIEEWCGNVQCQEVLYTATPTEPPREVQRTTTEVDALRGLSVGPGTNAGIPYAVTTAAGSKLVYLGDDGTEVFEAALPDKAALVTAGSRQGTARVAVALENGEVRTFARDGSEIDVYAYPPRRVQALASSSAGTIVQLRHGLRLQIRNGVSTTTVALPPWARLLGAAQGRLLYSVGRDVRTRALHGGKDKLLLQLDAFRGDPAVAAASDDGLVWTKCRGHRCGTQGWSVNWRSGRLPE